jgi:hypothetical protein
MSDHSELNKLVVMSLSDRGNACARDIFRDVLKNGDGRIVKHYCFRSLCRLLPSFDNVKIAKEVQIDTIKIRFYSIKK